MKSTLWESLTCVNYSLLTEVLYLYKSNKSRRTNRSQNIRFTWNGLNIDALFNVSSSNSNAAVLVGVVKVLFYHVCTEWTWPGVGLSLLLCCCDCKHQKLLQRPGRSQHHTENRYRSPSHAQWGWAWAPGLGDLLAWTIEHQDTTRCCLLNKLWSY